MTNRSTKRLRLIAAGVILGAVSAQGENRFALPADKTAMVNCQIAALTLHPGRIISTKTVVQGNKPAIHFVLKDKAAVDWQVVCDGLSGRIMKVINLDEKNSQ